MEGIAREEGLHAEEVRVEDGGEAYLVYGDFCCEGEDFGGVVEVVSEEHEPVIRSLASLSPGGFC